MISPFNPSDNNEIINRINKLKADSKRLWGKMQVSQMLAHEQETLKITFGETHPKRNFVGIFLGSYLKKKLTGDEKPFPMKIPTAKTLIITHHPAFEEERTKLIAMVKRFVEKGHDAITKGPHPFLVK